MQVNKKVYIYLYFDCKSPQSIGSIVYLFKNDFDNINGIMITQTNSYSS